jgi:putative heme-binding domain-containing protein
LNFQNPVELVGSPGEGRMYLVELAGKIYRLPPATDPGRGAELISDLKNSIPALTSVYGLAFDPRFAENRLCYICYVVGDNIPDGTRVSRFQMTGDDPPRINAATEQVIITWLSGGHNGGCLAFGNDGYLYISAGDAGPAFPPDPLNAGQDVSNVLSTIMRIDVDHPEARRNYAIPADNPFVHLPNARGEIWAYGLRNPWKMSFDRKTGDLWVGDVGWELWEMVYRVQPGDNYGWSLVEGPQEVHRERERGPTPIVKPAAAHNHTEARSITGGHVYHGARLPGLQGAYVYGDHVTGKIWTLRARGNEITGPEEIADTPLMIICFGLDQAGELYIVDYGGGIYRLVQNPPAETNAAFPRKLSETGLFADTARHQLSDGILKYSINAQPWMDGAVAERFIAMPGLGQIGLHQVSDPWRGRHQGKWKYPDNTVLGKTISMPRPDNPSAVRRIETQVLHYDGDTWQPYTYVWNERGDDAHLAEDKSFTIPLDDQRQWRIFNRTECMVCHTYSAGMILAFEPAQLDLQCSVDGQSLNQLEYFQALGIFEKTPRRTRPLVSPYGETADLEWQARCYLHVNCSHCHRRDGGGAAAIDVRAELARHETGLLDERPTQGTFNIHNAKVIMPGDPYRSVLFYRMSKAGPGHMPYLGSDSIDPRGIDLIHRWIEAMPERAAGQSVEVSTTEVQAALERQQWDQIDRWLDSTSAALCISHMLQNGDVDETCRDAIIRLGIAHAEPRVRDLFERFIPARDRIPRLGTSVAPDDVLKLTGDAERGRLLFHHSNLTCKTCHATEAAAACLGPNLFGIGSKYDRAKILENILQPSKSIDPKYVTYLVETVDGRVLTGLLQEKNGQQIVLRDSRNEQIHIDSKDVELLAAQQKSIMPELLLSELTPEQAADLVEYLTTLR